MKSGHLSPSPSPLAGEGFFSPAHRQNLSDIQYDKLRRVQVLSFYGLFRFEDGLSHRFIAEGESPPLVRDKVTRTQIIEGGDGFLDIDAISLRKNLIDMQGAFSYFHPYLNLISRA